nr:hypothetical protein [uncultured Sphaerochaeta sp.]
MIKITAEELGEGMKVISKFNLNKISEKTMNIHPNIEARTYIWTDDYPSFNKLIIFLDSDSKVAWIHRVNSLNYVYNFQSLIERLGTKRCVVLSPSTSTGM